MHDVLKRMRRKKEPYKVVRISIKDAVTGQPLLYLRSDELHILAKAAGNFTTTFLRTVELTVTPLEEGAHG